MIRVLLAVNIKRLRKVQGLSQEALAGACGNISEGDALANRSFISDLETARRNITLDKLEVLAHALGVEPYQLLMPEE